MRSEVHRGCEWRFCMGLSSTFALGVFDAVKVTCGTLDVA